MKTIYSLDFSSKYLVLLFFNSFSRLAKSLRFLCKSFYQKLLLCEIVFGSNRKSQIITLILIHLSTANVPARQLNLQKQHIKYKKVGLFCCLLFLFSGSSAVVLALLLRACESEQFFTAGDNKSQK